MGIPIVFPTAVLVHQYWSDPIINLVQHRLESVHYFFFKLPVDLQLYYPSIKLLQGIKVLLLLYLLSVVLEPVVV